MGQYVTNFFSLGKGMKKEKKETTTAGVTETEVHIETINIQKTIESVIETEVEKEILIETSNVNMIREQDITRVVRDGSAICRPIQYY